MRCVILGVVGVLCGSAGAGIVENGDFESPGLGLDGWIATGAVAEWNNDELAFDYSGVPTDFVIFNGGQSPAGNTVSQAVSLVAGAYTIGFDFGRWGSGEGAQLLTVSIVGQDGGVLSETVSVPARGVDPWSGYISFTFDFVIDNSGEFEVVFSDAGSGTSGHDGVLDNVTIVPGPGGLAAFGAWLLAKRRRRVCA